MSRLAWAVAALCATAFLAALAFTGGRGGPGLAPFVPRGLLTFAAEDVREVDVATPRVIGISCGRRAAGAQRRE